MNKPSASGGASAPGEEVVTPVVAEGRAGCPTSFAQERLLSLALAEPRSGRLASPAALRFIGKLDEALLERTLNYLLGRHDSLRTTFALRAGGPIQVVHEHQPVAMSHVDLRGAPDVAASLREEVERAIAEPFNLSAGPPLRAHLFRVGDSEHVLVVAVHRILMDSWSIEIFIGEMAEVYSSLVESKAVALPELPIQFGDIAVRERKQLQGENLTRLREFWVSRLRGVPTVLDLPTDRPRPESPSGRSWTIPAVIPKAAFDKVTALACETRSTPFSLLLSIFGAVLSRYTGQRHLLIGTTVANRRRVEFEGVIGYISNTIPLPIDVSGDSPFTELLRRVHEMTVDAFAHQEYPFALLINDLLLPRDISRSPVVQALFVLRDSSKQRLRMPGLTVSELPLSCGAEGFDIVVQLDQDGEHGSFEVNSDILDAKAGQRLWTHYYGMLNTVLDAPTTRIGDADCMAAEEIEALRRWNATALAGGEVPLHQDFFRIAGESPDLVAALAGDVQLTYGELASRASRVARAIRDAGATLDQPIGLCIDRSFDMLAGLLGILKAGCGYVPLDPAHPRSRLEDMIAQSNLSLVVTEPRNVALFSSVSHQIILGSDHPGTKPENMPERWAGPDGIACMEFTSGSTGRPKGVYRTHRASQKCVLWQRELLPGFRGRTAQYSPISFGVSLIEIFTTLGSGGALVLMSEEEHQDMGRLLALVGDTEVERLFVPPAALHALAEVWAGTRRPLRLKHVLTVGERLKITKEIVAFFDALPDCKLHNYYGTSETHVLASHTLSGAPSTWPALPPIGKPVPNVQTYVLDESMRPVPIGAVGDLFAAGDGVSRGYSGRPDLTAERYPPDPFGSAGRRLYATGDLARFTSDGSLEHLGRRDHQVKIRGFRIECGEVEAALRRASFVRDAVVSAATSPTGDSRLVAHVVCTEKDELSAVRELQTALRGTLPEYMIPAQFVFLDAFRLTPNGKLDRSALPPAPEPSSGSAVYQAPRNENERALARMFRDVLRLERVGVNDNFFELGGHSLLATQVILRVQDQLHVSMNLQTLLDHPTVADLSQHLFDPTVQVMGEI